MKCAIVNLSIRIRIFIIINMGFVFFLIHMRILCVTLLECRYLHNHITRAPFILSEDESLSVEHEGKNLMYPTKFHYELPQSNLYQIHPFINYKYLREEEG